MKKHCFLLLFILPLLWQACTKKEEKKTAPAVIKSIRQSSNGLVTSYSYNNSDLLSAATTTDGSKTTYDYNGDTITESVYAAGGALSYTRKLVTDSSGLVKTYRRYNDAGALAAYGIITYNANGYKTEELTYNTGDSLVRTQTWEVNDNDVTRYQSSDVEVEGNNYDFYYSRHFIEQENVLGNSNMGQPYFGKSSARLVRISQRYSWQIGNARYSYGYDFDEYGRAITERVFDHNNTLKSTNTITYR